MNIIKTIDDSDLYKLLDLHHSLQQLLPPKHNRSASALILFDELRKPNSMNLGLYNNSELVGFMNGYSVDRNLFHWSNLYVEPAHKVGAIKLIKKAEEALVFRGYKGYTAESILPEGKNILKRFGAKEI